MVMKRTHFMGIGIFLMGFAAAFGQAIPNTVTLRDFFGGQATFSRPVYFTPMPGKDSVYFVVEQAGTVQVVQRKAGTWVKSEFVTIPVSGGAGEDGLLGLAFHPKYSENKKYYLYFLRNEGGLGDYLVERTADATLMKDAGTGERLLLRVADPASNHNGGTIGFGPDNFLYIGLGDGGPQNDPAKRAQNLDTLLGKILRIDVDTKENGKPYGIPPSNPFVGKAGRPEIFAYGFRNPYRWSFHPTRGELWIGDVGQNDYEEVDLVPKGGNLGWRTMEGLHCRPAAGPVCDTTGLIPPVVERPHSGGEGAMIGGVFFQGDGASAFHDVYFFGDNSSGKIWGMRLLNGVRVADTQVATLNGLSAIASDSRGRVFAMSVNSNTIRILESPDMKTVPMSIRKLGKAFGPLLEADKTNLPLFDLSGQVKKGKVRTGIYIVRDVKNIPSLVPVLK